MYDKRIAYLDGLKGLAALMVFISHIAIISYYDSYVLFGSAYFGKLEATQAVLQSHPLASVFVNSCLGFDLFFAMIAIFPILQYRQEGSLKILGVAAVKRYFQLLVPSMVAALAGVVMYHQGLYFLEELAAKTGCQWLLAALPPTGCETWSDFFSTVFYRMWLGDGIYHPLTVVWCLCIILTGSWAVYGVYAIFGKCSCKYLPGLALLALSVSYPYLSIFALGSLLTEGVFLADRVHKSSVLAIFILPLGFIITKLTFIFYPLPINSYYLSALGCAGIIAAVHVTPWLRQLLAQRFLTFLGEISFEIVLVHALFLANIGCLFYSWLLDYTLEPLFLMLADFAVILVPTVLVSWLLHKYVTIPWNRWLKQHVQMLFGIRTSAKEGGE